MAIDPDIQPLLDQLEQRVMTRLDAMSNRVDQHANHLQVLGAADNALNSADKALEKQLAALTERVAALETTQAPSFPPAYFTDADIVRIQANGVTPAVSALLASKPGRDVLDAVPAPVVEVRAPSSGSLIYVQAHPELGGAAGDQAIVNDSHLAYVAAILWLATGDERYAVKAAELVDAWRVCERILFDQPRRTDNRSQVWANGKLVAAWSAPLFERAADIVWRTTGHNVAFEAGPWVDVMTVPVYGWTGNQNWILSQAAALLELGHPDARDYLIAQVPACIALGNSATNLPPAQSKQFNDTTARVKAWGSPTAWPDGLCQESFSDMGHALMGISAAVNAAAFCRNIGDPLPDEIEARIVAAVELHAGWLLQTFPVLVNGNTPTGWTPTGWPFTTPFRMGGTAGFNGWAVAAATFGDRVPLAATLAVRVAPEGFAHHSSYGTATHT